MGGTSAVDRHVAVVGLGNLGLALAECASSMRPVVGIDPDVRARHEFVERSGGTAVSRIRESDDWGGIERVHVVVRTTDQAAEILGELVALGEWPGSVHVHTTLEPGFASQLGRWQGSTLRVLEQPITGGAVGIRAGSFAVLTAGLDTTDDRKWLAQLGAVLIDFGQYGLPTAAKLLNNAVAAYNTLAAAAFLDLASNLGIAPGLMHEVLRHGSGGSWMSDALPALHADQVRLLAKDMCLLEQVTGRLPSIAPLDEEALVRRVTAAHSLLAGEVGENGT